MKKILAITAMAAFAAVSFAEGITFSAWLRALAAPVASNGEDTITAASNSWGGAPRTARLNVTAVAPDGNAGYNFGVYSSTKAGGFTFDAPDEHNLWVKPLDIVKLSYGKYDNGTLMGGVCYGSWNWLRPNAWIAGDEDLFMSKNGDTGLMAEITPMENLYIQALAPITNQNIKAGDTYKKLRAGFAYTVPGLVKIKGQYIGKGSGKTEATDVDYKDYESDIKYIDKDGTIVFNDNPNGTTVTKSEKDGNSDCTLEAEIDVLAVEGLFAGVGFQYNVIKDGDDKADQAIDELIAKVIAGTITEGKFNQDVAAALSTKMKIAAGVSYQVMPELKVSASGAFFQYYNNDAMKPRFQAGAGVDYDLGDGLAANADFRYMSPEKDKDGKKDNTDRMAFSVGVKKSVSSNGSIGVAFQGVTNSGNLGGVEGRKNDKNEAKNFVWAIPVAFEISF
ncbi:MAG: hypothetical protein IIU30_05435 [Treponema sp.]|nr:hypothetical protein [Treponema sp.]